MSETHQIIQYSSQSDGREQEGRYSFVYGYAATMERYPVLICVLILVVTFGCGAIIYLLQGIPSFDDPTLGFAPRGTLISSRSLSFNKFVMADQQVLSPVPHVTRVSQEDEPQVTATESIVTSSSRSMRNRNVQEDYPDKEQCPYPSFDLPKLVFESANGEDLFQPSHLRSMCRLESNLMRTHPTFRSECQKLNNSLSNTNATCCPAWSLGYAVALLNNKSSCEDIDLNDVERIKTTLAFCSTFYLSGNLTDDCEIQNCPNVPFQCKASTIIFYVFHYLVPRSFIEDVNNGLDIELSFSVSYSPMVVCEEIECEENIERIYKDNFTNSNLLNDGTIKILGIDFLIKFQIFDQLLLDDMVYVALGVFTAIVIICMYTRSFFITLGAILNMLMSLILATFVYYMVFRVTFFPFVNIVSCVLVIGIGADDTFVYVDLWKAAKKKIGKGKDNRILVLEEATKHAFVTLFVTSFTTSSALYTNTISYFIAGRCFGVFAGTALLANFVYTITWLPAIIVIHDKYFVRNCEENDHHFVLSCIRRFGSTLLSVPRAFFHKVLPFLIVNLRFVCISLFLLLGITGSVLTFVYPRLELQESGEFRLFQDRHPFDRYDQVYRGDLGFESDPKHTLPISFIWGVLPTTDQNQWDPLDWGTIELDPDFKIGSNETQNWLKEFCERIKEQSFYDKDSEIEENFCFIDNFRSWMERDCFPWEDKTCCEQSNFPFLEHTFHKCVVEFSLSSCQHAPCSGYTPGVRFDKNNSLASLYLSLPSSVSNTLMFKPVDEFWNQLLTWTEDQMSEAPEGLGGGWSYSQRDLQITFYDLQFIIVESTVHTISISIGAALIVLLLTTRNILLTLYAILTITLTVLSVVGCLVLLGWQLNIFEALTFSLAVGLSVDFTIHYGVAFILAPVEDRKCRTLYAIETLSSPITVAALSTFAAGAVMIPSNIINYSQIGVFLTLIISFSWLFSTFFFCSLCITVGPNGECGQLRRPRKFLKMFSSMADVDNSAFEGENE